MDSYVTADQCERTRTSIKGRVKWLGWLLVVILGVTGLTAEEAWRARSGFDQIDSRLERQTGVSEAQVKAIQRSLDRIDRKLEQQETVLIQILRMNHPTHEP